MILCTTGLPQDMLVEAIKLNDVGQMSVASIYLRFTDAFFFELRPAQAKAKLDQLNSQKHPFNSLSEAEIQIRHWAKLTSLKHANDGKRKQNSEWYFLEVYQQIMPEKYTAILEQYIERLE